MDIRKLKKLLKRKEVKRKLFLLAFLSGVILTLIGLYGFYYSRAILSFSKSPVALQDVHTQPNPKRIIIKDIKIDLDITEGRIVSGIWEISDKNATHLNISANPGENGNVIIYGHNKKVIFGSLPYLRVGSTVEIVTDDQKSHLYKVTKKETVKPDNVSFIQPTDHEALTIYTCTGLLDSKRFVAIAEPLK